MESASTKYVGWVLLGIGFLVAVTLTMSARYYGSLTLDPVLVWQGANMSARSLLAEFADDQSSGSPIDTTDIDNVSQKLKSGRLDYIHTPLKNDDVGNAGAGHDIDQKNLTNLRVANQAQKMQLAKDLDRLDQINQRLRDSERTLNAIKQEDHSYSLVSASIEDAERTAINAQFTDIEPETLSNLDAARPFIRRSGIRRSGVSVGPQSIPKTVLENIENSTGISPKEINKILNQ